jgi:hypothetical protein
MLCVAHILVLIKTYRFYFFRSVSLYTAQKREVFVGKTRSQINRASLPRIVRRWILYPLFYKSQQVFFITWKLSQWYHSRFLSKWKTIHLLSSPTKLAFSDIFFQHAITIHISSGNMLPPPESTLLFTIWNYALSIDYWLVLTTQGYTSSVYSTSLHGAKFLHVHREGMLRLFSKFVSSEINTTQETSFIYSNICTAIVEILDCHFLDRSQQFSRSWTISKQNLTSLYTIDFQEFYRITELAARRLASD